MPLVAPALSPLSISYLRSTARGCTGCIEPGVRRFLNQVGLDFAVQLGSVPRILLTLGMLRSSLHPSACVLPLLPSLSWFLFRWQRLWRPLLARSDASLRGSPVPLLLPQRPLFLKDRRSCAVSLLPLMPPPGWWPRGSSCQAGGLGAGGRESHTLRRCNLPFPGRFSCSASSAPPAGPAA